MTGVAGLLAVGVAVGLAKTWQAVRSWREDLGREKPPWERDDDSGPV